MKINSILKENKNILIACTILLIITFISFFPTLTSDFVDWDDYSYIVDNNKIRELSFKRVVEIFTTTHYGGYEPLTELNSPDDNKKDPILQICKSV